MQTQYYFHDKVIVRNPSLPFEPEKLKEQNLKELLKENWFRESVYLASPDLYDMAMNWYTGVVMEERKRDKMLISLSKYYSRMMSRCTPFGLFASCSLLEWREKNVQDELMVSENKEKHRHTRFDMHFLCALAQTIAQIQTVKENLIYLPNSSIYLLGEEIRYVEYKYINGQRFHQISAVTVSDYVEKVIEGSKQGVTYNELLNLLIDNEISEGEAAGFVNELIEAQLLVNNLEPSITGKEFIEQIIDVIQSINQKIGDISITNLLNYLQNINKFIKGIDENEVNEVEVYRTLLGKIKEFGIPIEENKLFQTDLYRKSNNTIDKTYQEKLLRVFNQLNKITPKRENDNLALFAKRFYERYEDKEMPLLEVMDTETGIGYLENNSGDINPLIEGVVLPNNDSGIYSMEWNKIQNWLFDKLRMANNQGSFEVEFKEEDFKDFKDIGHEDLPPSMSVMFKLIEKNENEKYILLEGITGSSSINLLGRFAHGDTEILNLSKQIANTEQESNPEVIFAEVIHLPESRVGNILLHPVFREYEIPYLAKSSLHPEKQIAVDDLYISVKFNKVILRSKRLNKIIIPRLSTAHNYSYRALPVYQFLCDLQTQNLRHSFAFHWGNMAYQHKFLPRVVYSDVVIHVATWQLNMEDFPFLNSSFTNVDIECFLEKWNMPQYVVLADGDNELFLDWKNSFSVKGFVDTIKNRKQIILKEFLYEKKTNNADEGQEGFINQCIALLIRNTPLYKPHLVKQSSSLVQRDFSIGSEWVYFKIYCGSKVADKILSESIKPLTIFLMENELIDKWFFIRYSDPQLHLRIRFHLTDITKIGNVIRCIKSYLLKPEEDGYIWKIQLDTYSRELERYGIENIVHAETFFCEDSKSVIEMLDHTWGDEREKVRWVWGIRAINDIFDGFDISIVERFLLLKKLKESFAQEFNVDANFKQQMDKKYRDNKLIISEVLDKDRDLNSNIYPLLKILINRNERLKHTFKYLKQVSNDGLLNTSIEELLSSYIHMSVNRLIPSNQRLHELFIYDFMFRTYESLIAREKKGLIFTKK